MCSGHHVKLVRETCDLLDQHGEILDKLGKRLTDFKEAFERKDQQELEDEDGMTVESRVISSSEKMMIKGAGKHRDLVVKVFHFFAVFPEDVPVPASFFNKMVPLLSNEALSRRAMCNAV